MQSWSRMGMFHLKLAAEIGTVVYMLLVLLPLLMGVIESCIMVPESHRSQTICISFRFPIRSTRRLLHENLKVKSILCIAEPRVLWMPGLEKTEGMRGKQIWREAVCVAGGVAGGMKLHKPLEFQKITLQAPDTSLKPRIWCLLC